MFRSLNSKFKSYAEPESLESDLHSPPTHPKSVFLVDPGTELAGNQTTYLTVRDAELQPTVNSKLWQFSRMKFKVLFGKDWNPEARYGDI